MTTSAPAVSPDALAPLRRFVDRMAELVSREREEARILEKAAILLGALLEDETWLPESHAVADQKNYRQYPLYVDPEDRFSVVSFVWGPGQSTPIHDHSVWGLAGVLRGAETSEQFAVAGDGLQSLGQTRLDRGAIDRFSPEIGDIHRVSNALPDATSISVHVYGADIGKVSRSIYDAAGRRRNFVSGYSAAPDLHL